MGKLSINSKEFKRFHQRRLDEKNYIAKKKIQEENELLREKIIQKEVEEDFKKYKYDWKKELLREFGEWAPIQTSGPANSTSTTFGYFAGGSPVINGETGQQVTFTYSGLNGIENYPTSVTIDQGFGDTFDTAPPPFSQIGIQGYTAKLNPRYKEAQEKYENEMKEWERKKEQQQRDIEATLKSFGTSWEAVRAGGGIVKVGRSYVALMGTNSRDFGSNLNNNVRVVRMVPCDPSKPMTLQRPAMVNGVKLAWHLTNSQYSDDVYLQIGQPPEPPMEQEYLMPRRTDFKDINPYLDASQEYAERVGADEFMNARVQDTPRQPSFFDREDVKIPRLNALGDKDIDIDDNELINKAIDLLNIGLDVAAVIGILFPEPGTTAGGLTRLATRGQRYSNIISKALQWYNKGRRPGEHKMSRMDRFRDEMSQRQRTSADPNSSWNPFRGMPGYGTAKSKLNPRIRAINNRRASQDKSPLSMDKINPGGAQTGPTPTFRQAIERQSSGTASPLNKSYVRRKTKEEEEKRR